jgi:intracellular septation protein A
MASRLEQAWGVVRRNGPGFGLEMLINAVLPLVIYDVADKRLGDVGALIASSVPPIVWSIVQFVRSRRVDAFSLLIITGIALSLLALLGGGGAKFLQLRENLVTGVIGAIFLVSAAIRRPLIYYLARSMMMRSNPDEARSFETLRDNVFFKRTMLVMTLVWGSGLVARTAVACVLVFSVPIPTYLALNPVLGYASTGALAGWTYWYSQRARRLGAERRAAAEAAAAIEAKAESPA